VNWNLLFGPRIAVSIHPQASARYHEIIFNRNFSVPQSQVLVSPVTIKVRSRKEPDGRVTPSTSMELTNTGPRC
jgi:hypothetical protein